MKYSLIEFWKEVRIDDRWQPNARAITPYLHKLSAPEWSISREPGDCVYVVQRGSDPAYDVPASNVRYARREPEPVPAPVAKGGKRG